MTTPSRLILLAAAIAFATTAAAQTNVRVRGTITAVESNALAVKSRDGRDLKLILPENATMTNAPVGSVVVGTGQRELTLKLKTGTHRVLVPEGTPVVRSVPGTRADLAVGEYLFANVTVSGDGTMTAPRVQVGKDGVRPPQ